MDSPWLHLFVLRSHCQVMDQSSLGCCWSGSAPWVWVRLINNGREKKQVTYTFFIGAPKKWPQVTLENRLLCKLQRFWLSLSSCRGSSNGPKRFFFCGLVLESLGDSGGNPVISHQEAEAYSE